MVGLASRAVYFLKPYLVGDIMIMSKSISIIDSRHLMYIIVNTILFILVLIFNYNVLFLRYHIDVITSIFKSLSLLYFSYITF